MGIFIIAGFVLVAETIIHGKYLDGSFSSYVTGALYGLMYSAIIFFAVGVISMFLNVSPVEHSQTDIIAFKDKDKSDGMVYIGTEEECYFFFKQTEKGQEMEKISINNSTIKETDTSKAKVVSYRMRYDSKIAKFIYGQYSYFANNEYVFYVPNDTATNQFSIDIE